MGQKPCDLPLETVLSNISSHLDQLAGRIYDIEETLGETLATNKAEISSITKFQSLDFIRQSLEDCAMLVHLLSTHAPPAASSIDNSSQMASRLRLDVTRSLMVAPANDPSAFEKNDADVGDVDLF